MCIIRGATACDFAIQVGTAERKVIIETSAHLQEPAKLKLDRHFQPCPAEPGDELYPNGIFEFNITQLLDFIRTQAEPLPIESVALADIPDYGGSARLDAAAIEAADLSRPVLLAEIAPGRYNLIDGHHRVAKARREGVHSIPAHRVRCPEHVAFLTSARAYEAYVNYWNDKVDAASGVPPARRRRRSARC